ncbi:YvrJ family protein [Aerococcus kribbianus]|uniref:YvrJ family protein n=1 Tax=Aerococcus kribbianus TaxID=2999064 RepID=A0A9X3JGI8_9LACT|nr:MULTISPECIES: YvrJ family protein [unclassified Aerococcus]MCZ0718026.1 YvrJ family protein [Aerococcus sp. YH-aer221]MCZ0726405.1 YvrJ family protein [Aerococcus sp. YH-aer222]
MEYIDSTWIEVVSNVGFPIFLSMYLMLRTEKKLDALIAAVQSLQK